MTRAARSSPNLSNASVRCLSNMKLDRMLQDRHVMSRAVREEASAQSQQWGYDVGSVYVRKVHFRDAAMIRQIEQKVVNRLRQVTAAIQQDGSNRVNIIRSAADREAAVEVREGRSDARCIRRRRRPRQDLGERRGVRRPLRRHSEIQQLSWAEGLVVQVIPPGAGLLKELVAAAGPKR